MMETQFTNGEFVEQGIRVEAGILDNLPYPIGAEFELSEPSFRLIDVILPDPARLFTCQPGRPLRFDRCNLCGLVVDGGLE